jgi:hypothetical protein
MPIDGFILTLFMEILHKKGILSEREINNLAIYVKSVDGTGISNADAIMQMLDLVEANS